MSEKTIDDFLNKKLEAIEVEAPKTVSQLLSEMANTGFQGKNLARVADVFEQQHAQHDFGRGLGPTAATALGAALSLCFVNAVQQLVIVEQLVDLAHPRFPKIGHFRGQQTVPQTRLGVFSAGHIG